MLHIDGRCVFVMYPEYSDDNQLKIIEHTHFLIHCTIFMLIYYLFEYFSILSAIINIYNYINTLYDSITMLSLSLFLMFVSENAFVAMATSPKGKS